jgi:hypothetical protein
MIAYFLLSSYFSLLTSLEKYDKFLTLRNSLTGFPLNAIFGSCGGDISQDIKGLSPIVFSFSTTVLVVLTSSFLFLKLNNS